MTDRNVAIIDGGGANIASLTFALARLGWAGQVTSVPDTIVRASHVILPGVGAAENAMNRLRQANLVELIGGLRQPVLGICLGMQLLFEKSEENNTVCLGLLPGTARLFSASPDRSVPHMGWNQIQRTRESRLLDGIPDATHFYFVHSYAVDVTEDTVATTNYGIDFTAVTERDNFMATQFHPERSGQYGARVLKNFLEQ
jgi:glutamine amidotransferase